MDVTVRYGPNTTELCIEAHCRQTFPASADIDNVTTDHRRLLLLRPLRSLGHQAVCKPPLLCRRSADLRAHMSWSHRKSASGPAVSPPDLGMCHFPHSPSSLCEPVSIPQRSCRHPALSLLDQLVDPADYWILHQVWMRTQNHQGRPGHCSARLRPEELAVGPLDPCGSGPLTPN